MSLHAFVAMPFGVKQGIDFNRIYSAFIRPALEQAGFTVFRADEEMRAGNIRTDMFQELLLADLVVADVSLDNPNVWYELGVRHALRSRGVIQIQSGRDYTPFDVYVDRSLRYHTRNGGPDPDFLEQDIEALAAYARETMNAWHERKVSPVYHLLPYLTEPDWKSLRVGDVREHWNAFEDWQTQVDIARKNKRPGDIMVLADEAPSRVLRSEALRVAAVALRQLGHFSFAIDYIDRALDCDRKDIRSQREKALLLGRTNQTAAAKACIRKILSEHPDDAESRALLGRVEKDAWIASWRHPNRSPEQMRAEALYAEPILEDAINTYASGFRIDPSHYYSGINALTLLHLFRHLTDRTDRDGERADMEGGVRWALHAALHAHPRSYWPRVTRGDIEVLSGSAAAASHAYRAAVAVAEKNWFALDASRQQLLILRDLDYRPEVVNTAIEIFDRALGRLSPPTVPRLTFLFSGHMIDRPDRQEPRFPPESEHVAANEIAAKLDELGASADDEAICSGACGGDILFAEAVLERGAQLKIFIPFDEPVFLQESVSFAGEAWRERYYRIKNHPNTRLFVMPEELGATPHGSEPYARNNLWQLYTALANGPDLVRFICLWNRRAGDGPGGTRHMFETVRNHAGRVYVLDTTALW